MMIQTMDLPNSNVGAEMTIDPDAGRIMMSGRWGTSWGPGSFFYSAYACYDLTNGGKQKIDEYGIWEADPYGFDAKGLGMTSINVTRNLIGSQYESGALISYSGNPKEVVLRVGVSFVSAEQACQNAEEEVGDASFEEIVDRSKALWNEKLGRVELDLVNTPVNITEMFYTSKRSSS
jgi:putative alpha-1,2-mannosidase